MEVKKFQEKMNSIQEKIGQDASNLILDEIGELLNDNKEVNEALSSKDKQIEAKNKTIETLQKVNGNLLQQVSMGDETELKPKPTKEEKQLVQVNSIAADTNAEAQALKGAMLTAILNGDTELQAELKQEYQELMNNSNTQMQEAVK